MAHSNSSIVIYLIMGFSFCYLSTQSANAALPLAS